MPADGQLPISGAVSNIYDPPPTTNSQWFWARIYNSYGYEDSDLAQVFVRPIPSFSLYPANQTIFYGNPSPTLQAVATNIPFVLNWYYGDSGFTTNLLNSVLVQGISTNYTNSAQISTQVAKELFPSPLRAGVSQIETFAACPFRHYRPLARALSPSARL